MLSAQSWIVDLGPNVKLARFSNRRGLEIQTYDWPPKNPTLPTRGALILVHGVTSHAAFEFLRHGAPLPASPEDESAPGPRGLRFDGSLVEKFSKLNLAITALDLQSHGRSECWNDSPCNADNFDDFAFDVAQLVITRAAATAPGSPVFVLGISMGAGIVLRAAQIIRFSGATGQSCAPGFSWPPLLDAVERSVSSDLSNDAFAALCHNLQRPLGVISLCPNLCLDALKKKALNRVLLPFSGVASRFLPNARLATLEINNRFPWIERDRTRDVASDQPAKIYNGKLPARIAAENLDAGQRIGRDAPLLFDGLCRFPNSSNAATQRAGRPRPLLRSSLPPLSILLVHALHDTMTSPDGSVRLFNTLHPHVSDVELRLLAGDDLWHYLTLEPGAPGLFDDICSWMELRMDQFGGGEEPAARL